MPATLIGVNYPAWVGVHAANIIQKKICIYYYYYSLATL